MSSATDVVSASVIPPVSESKDPMSDAGDQMPLRGGVDNSRCDGDRDDSSATTFSSGEQDNARFDAARLPAFGTSTPLHMAGVAILLVVIISSPLILPPPQGWYRAGGALVVLSILFLIMRSYQKKPPTAARSELLQLLVVLAATGMCVFAQLWVPSLEAARGFVIVPLVLSVMFHSIRTSLAANGIIAVAWAITWYSCGLTFTGHMLLNHLAYIPILSIALSVTQQKALRELASFHEDQHNRIRERHDAMRLVAEEASLRAKSEAELHRKHALLESILDAVPDEIVAKDLQRKVLVASRSSLKRFNLKLEDVLGQCNDKWIPKNLVESSREIDQAVLQDGKHVRRESVVKLEDGTEQIFEIEKLPLMENGEIMGVLGIARNITKRRAAEKRLKEQEVLLLHASRLSSMGELVAGIVHEINQPLYSILNYARAVKNTLDGPQEPNLEDISNWTEQILKGAARGGKVTERLRSFIRRAETQREQASVSAIVQESIDFIAGEARSSDVEIQKDLAENLPEVYVDRVQIQQVLVNLLKNAIEVLQDYDVVSPCITISTRSVPAGVEVVVDDNGPGVPAGQTAEIMEPFFTTKNKGVGLGLAICNTIIEAHESKLSCERNDSGGATFSFVLRGEQNRFQCGFSCESDHAEEIGER